MSCTPYRYDAATGPRFSSPLPPHTLYGIYTTGGSTRFTLTLSTEGGIGMPTYSFECRKCGKRFLEILSFREYEEGKRKCPKCGSSNVVQLLEGFYAKTSKKS
jgi:putative FmdB family regulatory protein